MQLLVLLIFIMSLSGLLILPAQLVRLEHRQLGEIEAWALSERQAIACARAGLPGSCAGQQGFLRSARVAGGHVGGPVIFRGANGVEMPGGANP